MPKAKNLKYLRTKAGLTQQAFADAIGASKSTVNAWETRKRAIPVPNTRRIADYFKVEYHDFCDVDLEHSEDTFKLSPSERQNILMFRELPENIKDVIRRAVKAEYENMKIHES